MPGGFAESPLRLNSGLGKLATWNEAAIRQRAEGLSHQAVKVWGPPALTDAVVATYRPNTGRPITYTLDDHPYLAPDSPMRPVFEMLRKQVLSLDQCVNEEILKLYVAYKAETNFVDVVPQKGRLSLSINVRFHELDDPRGLARDVTNLSRWGNGDAEVPLNSEKDLPYVMSLVRQAFEKQMGDGEVGA